MNVDKLLVEAGAYFGGDGINYDRFEPRKFAALVLATNPPQRKPLKLREIEKCIYDANNDPIVACRNVEAAHGIKENT